MTSRLLRITPIVFCLAAACDDDPIDPTVPVTALAVEVELPEAVQAGDSFDIVATISNDAASGSSAPLTVEYCYQPGLEEGCFDFVEMEQVGALDAGDSMTVTFRTALTPEIVGLGGYRNIHVCVRDEEHEDLQQCDWAPLVSMPDLAALCDPPVLTLPASGSVLDFGCDTRDGMVAVFALDVVEQHDYVIDYVDATTIGIDLFHEDGSEQARGSTPEGHWFVAERTGRVYIALSFADYQFEVTDVTPAGSHALPQQAR